MKIIAQTPNERVLVSVTESELANLLGHYSKYDVKREFIETSIKSEIEISISDIYQKHDLINQLQKNEDYQKARHALNALMNALTPIENKVVMLSKAKR